MGRRNASPHRHCFDHYCSRSPPSASAGTVVVEGSELVYRGDAAHERLVVIRDDEAVTFELDRAAVAGCPPTGCPLAGVTAIRVLTAEGDDTVVAVGPLPLIVDLGPGDDELIGGAGLKTLTINGGPGDDRIEATPSESGGVRRTPGATASSWTPGTAPLANSRWPAGRGHDRRRDPRSRHDPRGGDGRRHPALRRRQARDGHLRRREGSLARGTG